MTGAGTGQLLASTLHGPTWLTGGTAGPEGSAIGLAVLAISFPIFSRLSPILGSAQESAGRIPRGHPTSAEIK